MIAVIGFISAIISGISVSTTLYLHFRDKYNQAKMANILQEKTFEKILESSDIKALGGYLDKEIGQLTISDYVDNKDINKRIDILINKLTQFVGTDEQIDKETKEQENEQEQIQVETEKSSYLKSLPKEKYGIEFKNITDELYNGEPWNALARLRRYIEITLKVLAKKNDIPVENVHSILQLIDLLKQKEIIGDDIVKDLKFPIRISNLAIHGQDLKHGEAEDAILQAANALEKIGKIF